MMDFRRIADEIPGGTWLDDLARASAMAAHAKFERTARSPLLRVSMLGSTNLDAYTFSDISRALQDATARSGTSSATRRARSPTSSKPTATRRR